MDWILAPNVFNGVYGNVKEVFGRNFKK